LFYGKVVDFLDFDFFNFSIFGRNYDRWPIFNIADAAVSIGVLILLFFYKHHEAEDKKIKEAEELSAARANADSLNSVNEPSSKNINDGLNDGETDKGKEISL
jgi:signal peptidase II